MIDGKLLDDIKTVRISDKSYPFLLSQIYDPPEILYYMGELPRKKDILVSIVGSRKYTSYGERVTEEIAYSLAKEGLVIVSGLALGIDSIAHRSAIKAGGRTIAVLGSGLDIIYPKIHTNLAKEIIKTGGCLISEFKIGTPPYKANFPLRNRIVSGISRATIVIEAGEKSGALITAFSAINQNREVFAVPGSIYSFNSVGTNNLIKLGAYPLTCYQDVLKELKITQKRPLIKKSETELTEEERIIYSLLSFEPTSIDKLKELSKLEIQNINSILVGLEIKGLIKNIGGMQYIKVRNESCNS